MDVRNEQDRGHHDGGNAQGRDPQHLAQMRDLDLQRRRRVGRGVQQCGDTAHLGLHAGGDDDGMAAALRDRRALEDHVQSVAQRHGSGQQRRILQHRLALARQRRLQQLQRGGLRQARIGAHGVAFGEHQHVTLDELSAGHPVHGTAAQHS